MKYPFLYALVLLLCCFSVTSAQSNSYQIFFEPNARYFLNNLFILFELQNRLIQHNISVDFLALPTDPQEFEPDTLPHDSLGIIDFSQGGVLVTPHMARIHTLSPMLYSTEKQLAVQLGGASNEEFGLLLTALFQAAAGDCESALIVFDSINPSQNWEDLNMYRGNCKLIEGDYKAAIRYYENACDDAGGHICLAPATNIAWVYIQQGKKEEAIALMSRIVDDYTGFFGGYYYNEYRYSYNKYNLRLIEALVKRSQFYTLVFDYNAAIADMDQAILFQPDLAWLYVERGQRILLLYEWDRALIDFNRALELDPTYADAYYYRAILYASVPEGVEARQLALTDFQQYLALAPNGHHAASAAENIANLQALLESLAS